MIVLSPLNPKVNTLGYSFTPKLTKTRLGRELRASGGFGNRQACLKIGVPILDLLLGAPFEELTT